MKKMLVLASALLVLAVMLSACGAPAATPAPTAAPVVPATAAPTVVAATEAPTALPELTGDSIRGGKMYNSWITETGAEAPTELNPVWKASTAGEVSISSSWSCSKCHGYDYKGTKIFTGILVDAGKDPNEILAILKGSTDKNHDFSSVLDDQALTDLALFVSKEVMDASVVVVDNKPVNGKADEGKTLFDNTCKDCHGPESLAINFSPDSSPEYPATVAENGPKILHKIRFGQPGVEKMPAGIDNSWTNQNYADLIAYLQTKPKASPATEGGRMYDNWPEALAVEAPTADQPLWKGQKGNSGLTGGDTWLCSSCHGLDYKGQDGLNATGSEGYTGFPGILTAQSMSEADLTGWLDGSKNKDHDFKSYFNADEMARMVAFMQKGMIDHTAFIGADGKAVGDATHGKVLFTSVCKVCHGDDGKTINFKADEGGNEFLGNIATEEPWGFMHVATVGEPGARMPAGMNLGWSAQDIADVMAWVQTLPTK
ncbi:MAG: c-type cytochrome [Chloroflexi bacterium]|nr:c-type cytochrome [Chloroflexota bacterium]